MEALEVSTFLYARYVAIQRSEEIGLMLGEGNGDSHIATGPTGLRAIGAVVAWHDGAIAFGFPPTTKVAGAINSALLGLVFT